MVCHQHFVKKCCCYPVLQMAFVLNLMCEATNITHKVRGLDIDLNHNKFEYIWIFSFLISFET